MGDSESDEGDVVEVKNETKSTIKADESVQVGSKYSLYEKQSGKLSFCIFVATLINIGMLVYAHVGLSAVIQSTVCPEDTPGCPERIVVDGTELCVQLASDREVFVPGSVMFEDNRQITSPIGITCFGAQQCIIDELSAQTGLSRDCSSCFSESVFCATLNCRFECLPPNDESEECFVCFDEFCEALLETCTGVTFPERPESFKKTRDLQDDEDSEIVCLDKNEEEFFKVFNLTFINSVQESLRGGSIPLAFYIVITSGIWPYLKNVFMLYCWFVPLKYKTRDRILEVLAILGRWSFVDVFAVIVVMNGFIIQKVLGEGTELIAFAESRAGIYVFAISAFWDLIQGEYMREIAVKVESSGKLLEDEAKHIISDQKLATIKKLKGFVMIGGLLANVLLSMSAFSLIITFIFSGTVTLLNGPNEIEYTLISFGTELVSDCILFDDHGSPAGVYFLMLMFFLLVGVVPIVHHFLICYQGFAFEPNSEKSDRISKYIFWIGIFSCLDVFILTLATVATQVGGLVEGAVGDEVDLQCGVASEDDICVSLRGRFEIGTIFLLLSLVFSWGVQACYAWLKYTAKH